jgi:methyl-accepting chemotaxis protein
MTIRQKVVSVTLILLFLTSGVTSGTYYFWYLHHPHEQSKQGVGKDWVKLVIVVTVVMGTTGTAAAFVLSAHLARPITTMAETANAIANGDFNRELTLRRRDEIGQLIEAFRKMKGSIDHILEEMAGLMLAIREGKLDSRGNAEAFSGDWQELITSVNTVIDAFVEPFTVTTTYLDRISKGDIPNRLIEEYQGDFNAMIKTLNMLIDAMNEITWIAMMIASGNLDVNAKERSEQDRLMKALNTLIQQMSQRLTEVVTEVKSTANASAKYAEEVGDVVTEMVLAIQQISGKIAIIDDIATQTRILSLNTTIEAARVQEHGKAFSVVAAEVRHLAETTKKAAEEINQLTTSSFDISKKIDEMFTILVPSIHKTAELVQKINMASSEQTMNPDEH